MPLTLLHGDSHIGNTYRLPDGTGGLLDWQIAIRGHAMHDISYFITTSQTIDQRRANERDLIAFYRDRLQAYGVKNLPDMETLWREHRLACLWNFYIGWLPCPAENYGWELLVIALLRTSTALEDHETLSLARRLP